MTKLNETKIEFIELAHKEFGSLDITTQQIKDLERNFNVDGSWVSHWRYKDQVARKELKENGVITRKNIGYDELYILPKSKLEIKDEEVNITTDMTAAKMKQQFLKNFKSKKVSRVLLNKFIDKVA